MPNPYKVISLVLLAALSLGAMTVIRTPAVPEHDEASAPTLDALYAMPVEKVETHVLSNGQTLTSVLAQARISGQEMADLLLGLRAHHNPRSLAAGSEITVRRWVTSNQPRAVEVRVNADRSIHLTKSEIGWESRVVETPIRLDTVYTAGSIGNGRNSLYEAVVYDHSSGLSVRERSELVYTLASIYEYKLNFAREIQPGDSYRMLYERESRPDGSVRSMKILAAEIVTRGTSYPAIWFEGTKDVTGYFDNQARPLRTGFSRYPVEFKRITSSFNPRRYHPVLGGYRAHNGTDYGGRTGTPVLATADGTVTFAGTSGGYGRMVEIRHFNGYSTRYAHLSRFGSGMRVGRRVTQKQVIGYIGATGLATAPHLHYELRKNGRPVDAEREKLPGAPPIPGALKDRFMAVASERSSLLERFAETRQLAEAPEEQQGTSRALGDT